MTKEQLDAIRARVEAATPGPWEAGTAFCCPDMGWIDGPNRMVCPVHECTKRTHTLDANDAEFIAAARQDVPALLAEVERLTAERDALVQARENWLADCAKELRETADDMIAIRKEHERAAFKRGVAAMREAAVAVAGKRANLPKHSDLDSAWCRSAECILDELRTIPDPKDKP